jgi:L-ascorbate metabolism protein UlaG (beta-lactamase superfamily)
MKAALQITYIGHATILIEIDGIRIITDPFFRTRVWHLSRTHLIIQPEWYQEIDAILISHTHWDHLDIASLRKFDSETQVIAPPGARALIRKSGLRNILEAPAGDNNHIGDISILATHAEHLGKRGPFSPELPCLGFLIQGRQTVYFSGDTALFDGMEDLVQDLDIALLPVWGWGPTLGEGHMDPFQAAEATRRLSPSIAIPVHWGTLYPVGLRWLLPRYLREPPLAFAEQVRKKAPGVKVEILKPGEKLRLERLELTTGVVPPD